MHTHPPTFELTRVGGLALGRINFHDDFGSDALTSLKVAAISSAGVITALVLITAGAAPWLPGKIGSVAAIGSLFQSSLSDFRGLIALILVLWFSGYALLSFVVRRQVEQNGHMERLPGEVCWLNAVNQRARLDVELVVLPDPSMLRRFAVAAANARTASAGPTLVDGVSSSLETHSQKRTKASRPGSAWADPDVDMDVNSDSRAAVGSSSAAELHLSPPLTRRRGPQLPATPIRAPSGPEEHSMHGMPVGDALGKHSSQTLCKSPPHGAGSRHRISPAPLEKNPSSPVLGSRQRELSSGSGGAAPPLRSALSHSTPHMPHARGASSASLIASPDHSRPVTSRSKVSIGHTTAFVAGRSRVPTSASVVSSIAMSDADISQKFGAPMLIAVRDLTLEQPLRKWDQIPASLRPTTSFWNSVWQWVVRQRQPTRSFRRLQSPS
ncbi:hypothetical protein BC828DRAFT_439408 [Blastocladiella britannica]|nr:hypothetical protein BC828DRAFT_439408 [Blastocladiella britannica]